ncbi:MAG: hypothetical protein ACHQ0J_08170 [Candidatus Dormibacterales bacterium]
MKFRWIAGLMVVAWSTSMPAAGLAASSGSPTITLTAQSGLPGTPLTISGSGFPPLEVVALYIDSPGPYLGNPPPGPQADAQGAFQQNITWPAKNYDLSGKVNPAKAGPHEVCGDTTFLGSTQAVAAKACAQFTVNTIATPASAPGVPIPLALGGFVILIVLGVVAVTRMRRSDQPKP